MNIGKRIQELRELNNLSKEQLANLLNESLENIENYESNITEPVLSTKVKLAEIFKVSLDEFTVYNTIVKKEEVEETKEIVEVEEKPFAESTIVYNEDIFNIIFGRFSTRDWLLRLLLIIGYLAVATIIILTMKITSPFAIGLMYLLAAVSFLNLIRNYIRYKKTKTSWLDTYNNMKRTIIYYKDRFEILDEETGNTNSLLVKDFQQFVETDEYLISMHNSEQRLLLIINKSSFNEGDYSQVLDNIKSLEKPIIDRTNKVKEVEKRSNKIEMIQWGFVFGSIFSSLIISFILKIFTKDDLLWIKVLTYSLSAIIPLFSIGFGLISTIKFKKRALKNFIIGGVCLLFSIASVYMAVKEYNLKVKNNNQVLYSLIEEKTDIDFPNEYYTIYTNASNEDVSYDESFNLEEFRIITFAKKIDIDKLESNLKNATLSEQSFSVKKDSKLDRSLTYTYGCELSTNPNYVLSFSDGDNKYEIQYFDDSEKEYMVIITYNKKS